MIGRRLALVASLLAVAGVAFVIVEMRCDQARHAVELAELRQAIDGLARADTGPRVLRERITLAAPEASGGDPPRTAAGGDPLPEATTEKPPAPTAEQMQAVEQARSVVSAAVQAGTLRKQDGEELRRLHELSGGGREFEEVMQSIFVAINKGQLRPEGPLESIFH